MERVLNKILIIVFISMNLFALDFIDLYREKGIKSVEKEIEKRLKDKKYWESYLLDKDIELGYYESKKYIILTQKELGELALYKIVNKGSKELLLRDKVILGEVLGDKFLEGDKKTPLGVYDLTLKKTKLDQFYGPFALVTSYPNTYDKTLNKTGHGIWIHGMPLNGNRENYTKGCIALDNPRLKELEKNINLKQTIIITSSSKLKKASKNDLALILASIYKWKDAWKNSNINKYLSYYSKDFRRYDNMSFNDFKVFKTRVFNKNEKKRIKFSNINISPYPNSKNKNMYKVLLDEDYKSPSVTFIGKKELFVEIINNQVHILVED